METQNTTQDKGLDAPAIHESNEEIPLAQQYNRKKFLFRVLLALIVIGFIIYVIIDSQKEKILPLDFLLSLGSIS